jgi:hypothetical protein
VYKNRQKIVSDSAIRLMHMPKSAFDSWLEGQQIDPNSLSEEIKAPLREEYERAQVRADALRATTLNPGTTGGYHYAVAIEDGTDLRVTLWVKRSQKGECVILQPRDGRWDPHCTYHRDGRYHSKSYGTKSSVQRRQALHQFKGTEHLGIFYGHSAAVPKCDPSHYSAVIIVPPGILDRGGVIIDLVEPGTSPSALHREPHEIFREETYKDCSPWVVMAVTHPRHSMQQQNERVRCNTER